MVTLPEANMQVTAASRTLRRKRVIAVMTILARDAAGNQRRVERRVKIARRR